jgi:hypothetical protein
MKSRSVRTFAVLAAVSMIVGAFAVGPAEAQKKKKKKPAPTCPAFTPPEVQSGGTTGAEAAKAEVVQLTTAHTAEAPLVIEFTHGPALWDAATHSPIQEDTKYFAVQLPHGLPESGVHAWLEWGSPSPSDIDLYMYDEGGNAVANSGAFNTAPVPGVLDASGNGGNGFESIPGFPAVGCNGFVFESQAFLTPGEDTTLTLWLGEVTENWNAP